MQQLSVISMNSFKENDVSAWVYLREIPFQLKRVIQWYIKSPSKELNISMQRRDEMRTKMVLNEISDMSVLEDIADMIVLAMRMFEMTMTYV